MEEISELARRAAAALSGTPAGRGPVDLALAEAHGIAPLLGAARALLPGPIDAELQALFEENAGRQSVSHSILLDIAACSATTGFEWLVLNGQPQAAFLYPDAGWRAASGIDLLVPTGQSHHIAHLLRSAGWSPAPSRKPSASLGRAGLRTDPRIILTGSTGSPIALHDRLFFSPGPIGTLLLADADRRPRRSMHRHDVPAPRPDATMALDILLRGNARRWARLKWLVDLSAIIGRLDDGGHAQLIALIGRAGIEPLAAASFLTHRALVGALPGPIEDWLEDRATMPEIATRHVIHLDAIMHPASTEIPSLPTTDGMRLRLPRIARPLARGLRGRLATWTRKAGQYQRDPATRNDRYPLAFRFARDQLGDEEALHILSFGCSTGEEVFTLRRYFPSARIKGIEVDPARVGICEARRRQAGDPGIRFECAATASGEPPESSDAIFCMAVFRDPVLDLPATRSAAGHLAFEEFDRGIEDLVRALKPGGLLFVEHSNFRVADTGSAPVLEPVLHADPPRSGIYPGLYGRDGRRIDGAEETALGYRKRFSLQTGQA